MRYDKEQERLVISCREFVANARRGICAHLPRDEDEPGAMVPGGKRTILEYCFDIDEYSFRLDAAPERIEDGAVYLRVPVDSSPKRPRKEITEQARGEGHICAHILAQAEKLSTVKIVYTYENRSTAEVNIVEEFVSVKKLEAFFNKCKMSTKVYAKPEIERVTERLPSLKGLRFPYERIREGQSEIMQAVHKAIAHGERLFTSAPTGTGKTVSMLYPALRALGEEKCEKVFYFTPKTTTANAVRDCIQRFCDTGAKIKSIILPSKDRICQNGRVCKQSKLLCENSKNNKLADAVLELYNTGVSVVSIGELNSVAGRYRVCPHELALSYCELCDVVICDLNYLFNPKVYIRRFFSAGGDYAFLIDEAHNLPDRAREMYSAEISENNLLSPALSELFGEHSDINNVARGAASAFGEIIMPYVKEELFRDGEGALQGAAHISDAPRELYPLFDTLLSELEEEIYKSFGAKDEEAEARTNALREYYYRVKEFRDTLEEFDNGYEFFIFYENGRLRAKCYCIDPAKRIAKQLSRGTGAVFFSGTLTPLYYYHAVLGGDRGARTVEVESPFDESQISVCIMDKISTRHSERDDTLGAVCRAIAATVSAKRGNYMIFSPSFAYSAALCRAFKAKYPKIRVIEQTANMTAKEKAAFLSEFEKEDSSYLIGFCVMGGIYSEGVDLAGESLIGSVVVGIGIPSLSYEREAIQAYYNERFDEGKQFAYIYPGINRVLQAAGRVIRREDDRGVVVLIDDRFDDPIYKSVIPKLWKNMKYIASAQELRAELDEFWKAE